MSESPGGPGWWLASDGRWYPPAAPVPTPPQAKRTRLPWVFAALVVVVALGLVAVVLADRPDAVQRVRLNAASRQEPSTTTRADRPTGPPPSIVGAAPGELTDLVAFAIADIQAYWKEQLPATYGVEYQPISGGVFASSPGEPLPPCAESSDQIEDNAYYCSLDDVVAYDDTGLLPRLLDTYGALAVGVVLAHEVGHATQARVGFEAQTSTKEVQADCFAGAWVQDLAERRVERLPVTAEQIDASLAGFLELADTPGTAAEDPNAHGSAFDRLNAFQDGSDGGPRACSQYRDGSPALFELPFETPEEAAAGDDLPYEEVVQTTVDDLEAYWGRVASNDFSQPWKPLGPVRPFPKGDAPACGADDTSGYSLFYCADGNFIAFESTELFPTLYESYGDFAVSTLLATQYGLAAQLRLGLDMSDARGANLTADCFAGAWAGSVFREDREDARLRLSPGDLDEAVTALLVSASTTSENAEQGAGFERVASYRKGVLGGATACADR